MKFVDDKYASTSSGMIKWIGLESWNEVGLIAYALRMAHNNTCNEKVREELANAYEGLQLRSFCYERNEQ